MTTLITSGTGLVGDLAARWLLQRGEEVVLYDVAPQMNSVADIQDRITVIRGDILDFPDLLRAIESQGVDRIIHTPGLVGPGAFARPYATVKINAVGTANVLEAARMAGVSRVVFCSSGTVYDTRTPCTEPLTEEFPLRPYTIYASTKVFGENLVRNYGEVYGLDVVTVRFAGVYGCSHSFVGGGNILVQALVDMPALGRPVVVRRPATDMHEFLHASDAAKSTVLACFADSPQHKVFNIGTGRLTSFDEMVGLVRELIPGAEISVKEADTSDYHRLHQREVYQPHDISRAQAELGYAPEYDLKRGLTEYIQWIRQEEVYDEQKDP